MFIPSNPFYAYANAIVPAVVVFSILVGIAAIGLPNRSALLEPLTVIRDILTRITGIVSKLAPLGVFALMANVVGTTDIADLARLQVYIVLYALIALILGLFVLPGLIAVFTPLRYRSIVRALRTPLITAFATGSSLIVLPLLIEQSRQLIIDAEMFDAETQEDADAALKVLIPTAFTFPSPAVLLSLSFILFGGWYVGLGVSADMYPMLVLAGVPSLFGGPILTIPFLLDLVKLPSDLFQVFVAVDVINSRFGTLLAAMHFATVGLIGTTALVGGLRLSWARLARVALIGSAMLAAVLLGMRAFYTYGVVVPYAKADVLQSLQLLDRPQPAKVYNEVPPHLAQTVAQPADLEQIKERGVIRVCFQPGEYPSAFYNNADPPQLVRFDVEMAHRFAQRLRLPLEFLPANGEEEAAALLDAGACDLYMRTLPVTARRTSLFAMSAPVYQSSLGLIVKDHRREEFKTWDRIKENEASLRLAFEETPENVALGRFHFPNADLLPLPSMEDQRWILESGGDDVDAIFDMAEEGAAWTVLYPSFSLVVPKPTEFMPVGYAVAHGNASLLTSFNAWLLAEKSRGTVDALYGYWMLGEAARTERPPRWSVIKDVLGWVN